MQETLRQAVFAPIISSGPRARWRLVVAAIMTFIVSGVFHEVAIARIFVNECTGLHCGGDMLLFFVLNGIVVMAERIIFVFVERMTGFIFERDAYRWFQALYTIGALVWLAPLFCDPLIRLGVHQRLSR